MWIRAPRLGIAVVVYLPRYVWRAAIWRFYHFSRRTA